MSTVNCIKIEQRSIFCPKWLCLWIIVRYHNISIALTQTDLHLLGWILFIHKQQGFMPPKVDGYEVASSAFLKIGWSPNYMKFYLLYLYYIFLLCVCLNINESILLRFYFLKWSLLETPNTQTERNLCINICCKPRTVFEIWWKKSLTNNFHFHKYFRRN